MQVMKKSKSRRIPEDPEEMSRKPKEIGHGAT